MSSHLLHKDVDGIIVRLVNREYDVNFLKRLKNDEVFQLKTYFKNKIMTRIMKYNAHEISLSKLVLYSSAYKDRVYVNVKTQKIVEEYDETDPNIVKIGLQSPAYKTALLLLIKELDLRIDNYVVSWKHWSENNNGSQ